MLGALTGAVLVALGAQTASAATLYADYELQGTYTSSGGVAPALSDIGTGNAFETDTVNGLQRQVLAFPQGNGLQMINSGDALIDDWSLVMLFKLDSVSDYRRIFDGLDGASENGVYAHDGKIDIYFNGTDDESSSPVLADDTYTELVLVADQSDGTTKVFVDGALAVVGIDLNINNTVRFFKDNTSGPLAEEAAGKVACIRAYIGRLTDLEVAQIHVAGPCTFAGTPPPGPIDSAAPSATITERPKDKTKKKTATFGFTGSDARAIAGFQCSLDDEPFRACSSPVTYKVKKGKHSFEVQAVDEAGNVSAPASDTWKRKKKKKEKK